MSVNRFVSFFAAIGLSAIQWAALFSPLLHTPSVLEGGVTVAEVATGESLPVIVVTARRVASNWEI